MGLFFNHSQQKHKNRPKTQLVYKKNGAFTRNNKLDKQVERERESERAREREYFKTPQEF